jgi:hypothetical protein
VTGRGKLSQHGISLVSDSGREKDLAQELRSREEKRFYLQLVGQKSKRFDRLGKVQGG